ncbi:Endonuclease III [hydrothermal vent metagenome]|uniref:Endonuclease III n=1 Tax=hydrothermal vent metagenome TaxID=652676 RepID=A0A3B0QXI4_9ZZZZ
MQDKDVTEVFAILKKEYGRFKTPYVTIVSEDTPERLRPYHVLVSCILSLRTKDNVTAAATRGILAIADTPEKVAALPVDVIEKAIYPAGFYRTKAVTIKNISGELVDHYSSVVPDTVEGLLKFKGVGRKTANLVVTLGYALPGICVDTHVHRITNHWGYVSTKTPDKTETALRDKLPKKYWIPINDYLVAYGQNLCKPVSPHCSECRLYKYCERIGVKKSR